MNVHQSRKLIPVMLMICTLFASCGGCCVRDEDGVCVGDESPSPEPSVTPTLHPPTPTSTPQPPLCERAGVDMQAAMLDFGQRVLRDARVNGYFLNGSLAFDPQRFATCMRVEVCNVYGTQIVQSAYACKPLLEAHVGMGISSADYADYLELLQDALAAAGVSASELETLNQATAWRDVIEDPDSNKTQYQRMGRKPLIEAGIERFWQGITEDPAINGYFLNQSLSPSRLKLCLTRDLCAIDGPCIYGDEVEAEAFIDGALVPCKALSGIHTGMNISDLDANDYTLHLLQALQDVGVPAAEAQAVYDRSVSAPVLSTVIEDPYSNGTLYQRMGRKIGIDYGVSLLTDSLLQYSNVNGYFLNSSFDRERYELCLTRLICGIDGPCIYGEEVEEEAYIDGELAPCRDMLVTHEGKGISDLDFQDFTFFLIDAFERASVNPSDVQQLFTYLVGDEFVDAIIDPNASSSLYYRLGRKQGLEYLVEEQVKALKADPSLSGFFTWQDQAGFEGCLIRFLCDIDGPCIYGDDIPELGRVCGDLGAVHSGKTNPAGDPSGRPITTFDLDAWYEHVDNILLKVGTPQQVSDELRTVLFGQCGKIVSDPQNCP